MFSGLMQDWTTMDGSGTAASVQARADWLDLAMFADVVFWLEVRAVSNPGAGNVTLTYETSPSSDEGLFQPLGAVTFVAAAAPVITKVQLSSNPAVPLARFVRWRLAGTAAGNWSVTFRIFAMANKGSAGLSDPSSMALSGWWRVSYSGAPWTGTASAGPSSGRSLNAGVAPGVGGAVSGFTPSTFDGTSQYLVSSVNASSLVTTGAGTLAVLANIASLPADAANVYQQPALVAETDLGASCSLGVSTSGLRAELLAASGYVKTGFASFSTGAWHLHQMRWDGANLECRVDGGAWQTVACAGIGGSGVVSSPMNVGGNYLASVLLTGSILEVIGASSAMSDAMLDSIRGYASARYGITV